MASCPLKLVRVSWNTVFCTSPVSELVQKLGFHLRTK